MKVSLTKKLIIFSVVMCFALAELISLGGFLGISTQTATAAEQLPAVDDSDIGHFYYKQLTAEQKEFYKAMEAMYDGGKENSKFIKGEDYDLVANNHVTQAQLEAYANGDSSLINVMGAARDAFYSDNADIFYVDFSYLSLRVTQDNSGKYHAYLGSGRSDSYYVQGFNSAADINNALRDYVKARDAVVNTAKTEYAEPSDDQVKALGKEVATTVEQIRVAHRLIAENTVYRLESEAGENVGHVRTPYGAFVKGMALCEGYSRAFKAVMDQLGVPCVLIQGGYRHTETQMELHMWAYVKLDGAWYAVDQTFDDLNLDDKGKKPPIGDNMFNFTYTEDYFLKGAAVMNSQHVPSPQMSDCGYEFTYPTLSDQNLGAEVTIAHGGLFQIVQEPNWNGKEDSTDIKVSVFIDGEWCGYAEAEKKGYYILMRHEGNYLPEQLARAGDLSHVDDNSKTIENTRMVWGYLNPVRDPEPLYPNIVECDGYTLIQNESKSTGFEFALTTVPPRAYDYENRNDYTIDQIAEMTTYLGDPTILTARSGVIETKYGDENYVPAPHILRSTPTINVKLKIGYSYDVTVEYDQLLELMDGATSLEVSVYGMRATGEILKGTNAVTLDVIKNVTWDRGELTSDGLRGGSVSFTFTPSALYAHDEVAYYFNFNLQGKYSGKQVNPAPYVAGYPCTAYCYRAYGIHWNVFGQPQLLEEGDLSMNDWTTSDGKSVGDLESMKDRLALVVTAPSKKQEDEMNGLLENELGLEHQADGSLLEDAFQSFTYNIQLSLCKSIVISTGQGVRICIGFPEGFTYDSSLNGVKFEAYHFKRDAQNNVIGVEPIECTVTPLGLILLCKSFSPFAIVASKSNEPVVNTDKTVILSSTYGGTAFTSTVGENETKNLFKLTAGGTREVTVKANAGYVIESIKINGTVIETNYESEKTLVLKYDDLTSSQVFVEVNFVAEKVKAADESRGETFVIQKLKTPQISISKTKITKTVGETLVIKATVTTYSDSNVYQWFKDGKAIEGQTSATLTIENVDTTDSGKYTLKVTSSSGSSIVTAESEAVEVTVKEDSGFTDLQKTILIALAGGLAGLFLVLTIASIAYASARRKREK